MSQLFDCTGCSNPWSPPVYHVSGFHWVQSTHGNTLLCTHIYDVCCVNCYWWGLTLQDNRTSFGGLLDGNSGFCFQITVKALKIPVMQLYQTVCCWTWLWETMVNVNWQYWLKRLYISQFYFILCLFYDDNRRLEHRWRPIQLDSNKQIRLLHCVEFLNGKR